MSLFKRLSATISGHLDQAVTQIENQDAVIDAIVREARQALASAKVRLARVETDGNKMTQQQKQLEQTIAAWTDRAKRSGEGNQQKAIECLRQRKAHQSQLMQLNMRLQEHTAIRQRLTDDVRTAESKVTEILHKQHLMRTRESAANAIRGASTLDTSLADELNSTFERWEIKVTESELTHGTALTHTGLDSISELEQDFISQEESEQLQQELAELMVPDDTKDA